MTLTAVRPAFTLFVLLDSRAMHPLPGRNDPCHCGSGLKYKKCHETSDREAASSPRLRLLSSTPEPARRRMLNRPPASQLSREWELEISPMPGLINDDPAARLAAIFVVAPPFVLACETVNRPSAEPEELAALMAHELLTVIQETGLSPTHVSIRHASLMTPIADVLIPHGVGVMLQEELPGVNDALQGVLAHVFGGIVPLNLLRSQPETWAGWGMPEALVIRMFEAAAAFHRAAPWSTSDEEIPLTISRSGGHEWTAIILGGAGTQMGLSLYYERVDLETMALREAGEPAAAFNGVRGQVLSLLFNTRTELPKRMREEIKHGKLEIAGPSAYPTLFVMNTPGGGVRQEHFEDLCAALESAPRFVDEHASFFQGDNTEDHDLVWTDPENGVTCRVDLEETILPHFMDTYAVLHTAGAEGPGAQVGASITPQDIPRVVNRALTRYRAWLRKPAKGKPPTEETVSALAGIARSFIELCAFGCHKPVTAVNEYDLRTFLYDWFPRHATAETKREARSVLASLRRFFAFLELREQVVCPWAEPMLADVKEFDERWSTYQAGSVWYEGVDIWRTANTLDLAARMLIPLDNLAGGVAWGDVPGDVEHVLSRESHRLWLATRDEAVRAGITAPKDVRAFVEARQRTWANTPNATCNGLTPIEAVARDQQGVT